MASKTLQLQLEKRLQEINVEKLFNTVWSKVLDKLSDQLADLVLDKLSKLLKDKIEIENKDD